MDRESTTQAVHRASDGPLCSACAAHLDTISRYYSLLSEASDADEQWLPTEDNEIDQRFLRVDNELEHRFPHEIAEAEPGFPSLPLWLSRTPRKGELRLSRGSPIREALQDRKLHVKAL